MASNRASTSRLSLEDWDQLSPLSPNEITSIQRVNQAARLKPIPLHVSPTLSLRRHTHNELMAFPPLF
jgi:hypothetical protein